MIKMFALLPKREDITDVQFHEHWSTIHREHALRITRLRRYVQAHRIDVALDGPAVAPYDGIPEVWYDDLASAVGQNEDPDYTEYAQRDEPNFVAMGRIAFVPTAEHVVHAGDPVDQDAPGFKVILLLRRAAGVSPEDFAARWPAVSDAALAPRGAVLRSVSATALPETYADGDPTYDGFAELFWDDLDALRADWSSFGADVLAAIAPVADLGRSHLYVAEELRVIWPAGDAPLAPSAPTDSTEEERS